MSDYFVKGHGMVLHVFHQMDQHKINVVKVPAKDLCIGFEHGEIDEWLLLGKF